MPRRVVAAAGLVCAVGASYVILIAHSTRSVAIEVRDLVTLISKRQEHKKVDVLVRARVKFTRNGAGGSGEPASIELVFEGATYDDVQAAVDATVASLRTRWGAAPTVSWLSP